MENQIRSLAVSTLSVAVLVLPGLAQEAPPRNADERHAAAERQKLEQISAGVRGRCVDAATGKPLAGCVVKLSCTSDQDADLPREAKEGQGGMAPIRIEVPRLVAMMVQVLDAKGAPAASVEVLVIEPGNHRQPVPGREVNDMRVDHQDVYFSDPDVTIDTKISSARTDGGGQCVVYGLDGRDDLILGLRRADESLQRVADVAFGQQHKWRQVRLERQ